MRLKTIRSEGSTQPELRGVAAERRLQNKVVRQRDTNRPFQQPQLGSNHNQGCSL